jgi:transposase-like protein
MTDDAMLGGFRRRAILRAQELGNVSRACREFGLSRTTYYRGRLRMGGAQVQ